MNKTRRAKLQRYVVASKITTELFRIKDDPTLKTLLLDFISDSPSNSEMTTFSGYIKDDLDSDSTKNQICVKVLNVLDVPKNLSELEQIFYDVIN